MRAAHFTALLFAVAILSMVATATAQEVTATSRSAGMGEALSAGASGTSAIWHNPAGIATALMYSAEAGYAYDSRKKINAVTANLVDTKSNAKLGGGLGFVYETGDDASIADYKAYHFRGGLAVPLVQGLIKVGVSAHYADIDREGLEKVEALVVDGGLVVQPTDGLNIGVAVFNLANGGFRELMPRTAAAGIALASLDYGFHVSGDMVFNLDHETPADARTWRAGIEVLAADTFPVRAGYQYDELAAESVVSVGAGFRDRGASIGLDASYQHNLDDAADKVFVGSLAVYF